MRNLAAMGRRKFLATGSAGLALMATTTPTWAQSSGEVVVSNWGGDFAERVSKHIEQPLVERTGLNVVLDLGMDAERKTKLLTEKRLNRGSVDVIHLNGGDAYELYAQEVLAELDPAKLEGFEHIVPAIKTNYAVPILYTGMVLIYDQSRVKEAPSSYADLWDEKWAGRIGFTNQLFFNYMMMAGLVETGNVNNAEGGFEKLLGLKNVVAPKIYATHQHLQAALATGEIDVAVNYKGRGLQWKNDGLSLGIVTPSEGAIASVFGVSIPVRAPNPDAAYDYLRSCLDPVNAGNFARASFYAPGTDAAVIDAEVRIELDFSEEEKAKLQSPDYAYIAANTAAWLDWWNKNVSS